MGIRMPGMDGIAATRAVAGGDQAPQVIVLTTFDTDGLILEAVRAGPRATCSSTPGPRRSSTRYARQPAAHRPFPPRRHAP
ncbi:DNA-binding response regulator OS=Streptomyces paromomycinus OX=92743 GN=GKJPGBOP_02320 PE=4 SV=1 [Streptomyces rimosus subsp. rimosus]